MVALQRKDKGVVEICPGHKICLKVGSEAGMDFYFSDKQHPSGERRGEGRGGGG